MRQVASISISELEEMAAHMYGELVKGVVDVARGVVVLDADLHVDEEQFLLEQGSKQADLWGINLYPEYYGGDDFLEFDSMINIRPAQGNRSRGVEDEQVQQKMRELIAEVVHG